MQGDDGDAAEVLVRGRLQLSQHLQTHRPLQIHPPPTPRRAVAAADAAVSLLLPLLLATQRLLHRRQLHCDRHQRRVTVTTATPTAVATAGVRLRSPDAPWERRREHDAQVVQSLLWTHAVHRTVQTRLVVLQFVLRQRRRWQH